MNANLYPVPSRPRSLAPRRPSLSVLAAAVAGAALLGLVGSFAPPAAAHAPDPVIGGPFAQNQALFFDWRTGWVPPSSIKAAIKTAAADAKASRGSQAATFALKDGAPNPIGYGMGATCGVNGIACFTRNAPVGFTMWLREQGHEFDWGTMKWCQTYQVPPNGCFDAETVALDEFGHILGLGHHENLDSEADYLDAVVQTYSHAKPEVGWNMHRFGVCDIATLQREYDVVNTSAKISTCLELVTKLTLSASPTVVNVPAATTLTATLKVGSSTAYGRLQGNPLSGRTVTLQRRASGATTWATLGTMPPGGASGSYVLTHRPTVRTEYRAVFQAPADEGLDAVTSAVVIVQAIDCSRGCPLGISPATAVIR